MYPPIRQIFTFQDLESLLTNFTYKFSGIYLGKGGNTFYLQVGRNSETSLKKYYFIIKCTEVQFYKHEEINTKQDLYNRISECLRSTEFKSQDTRETSSKKDLLKMSTFDDPFLKNGKDPFELENKSLINTSVIQGFKLSSFRNLSSPLDQVERGEGLIKFISNGLVLVQYSATKFFAVKGIQQKLTVGGYYQVSENKWRSLSKRKVTLGRCSFTTESSEVYKGTILPEQLRNILTQVYIDFEVPEAYRDYISGDRETEEGKKLREQKEEQKQEKIKKQVKKQEDTNNSRVYKAFSIILKNGKSSFGLSPVEWLKTRSTFEQEYVKSNFTKQQIKLYEKAECKESKKSLVKEFLDLKYHMEKEDFYNIELEDIESWYLEQSRENQLYLLSTYRDFFIKAEMGQRKNLGKNKKIREFLLQNLDTIITEVQKSISESPELFELEKTEISSYLYKSIKTKVGRFKDSMLENIIISIVGSLTQEFEENVFTTSKLPTNFQKRVSITYEGIHIDYSYVLSLINSSELMEHYETGTVKRNWAHRKQTTREIVNPDITARLSVFLIEHKKEILKMVDDKGGCYIDYEKIVKGPVRLEDFRILLGHNGSEYTHTIGNLSEYFSSKSEDFRSFKFTRLYLLSKMFITREGVYLYKLSFDPSGVSIRKNY